MFTAACTWLARHHVASVVCWSYGLIDGAPMLWTCPRSGAGVLLTALVAGSAGWWSDNRLLRDVAAIDAEERGP